MLRKVSVRFTAVALAAGSLAIIPLSAPSSAATKVACTKEASGKPVTAGSTITVKATLGGCSASVGGSGKSVTTIKGSAKPVSKTTWAGGKGTTTQTVTYKAATKAQGLGKCPAGTTQRLFITATTTGGTGAALKAIPKGSIGKSNICLKKDSTGVLEPGTKATF